MSRSLILKSPNFRKHLSQALFYSTYGATDADYQALKNWANSAHGFTISATYPNHLLLERECNRRTDRAGTLCESHLSSAARW